MVAVTCVSVVMTTCVDVLLAGRDQDVLNLKGSCVQETAVTLVGSDDRVREVDMTLEDVYGVLRVLACGCTMSTTAVYTVTNTAGTSSPVLTQPHGSRLVQVASPLRSDI